MKIAVDIGHNCYPDMGASNIGDENTMNMDVGRKVISKLKDLGHDVICVTPDSCTSVNNSLYQRTEKANSFGADIYVSIHFNCGGGYGCEVWCGSSSTTSMASDICNLLSALGFRNRGVKIQGVDGGTLYVLNHSNMKALLIEGCFVDSQADMDLYNRVGAEGIANAIVKGITGQDVQEQIITPKTERLQKQIESLIYWLNIDYSAHIATHPNGGYIKSELYPNLEAVGKIITLNHKSHLVNWIQQKLEMWGYLKKGSYTAEVYDKVTLCAVTELQKNWSRPTDGKLLISNNTWQVFLENE